MAKIRLHNLRREEVDTVDEVQRAFNDVYRVLREQQNEIEAKADKAAVAKPVAPPVAPAPAPEPKHTHKKEYKQ